MKLYHINEVGEPGRCTARLGKCPYGGAQDHYLDEQTAREAYELKHESFDKNTSKAKALALNTKELSLIESKLLAQALKLASATNGEERELVETETTPIAIIRASRVEERAITLEK